MNKLKINTSEKFNETIFEYFITDLFNLTSKKTFYKRGKRGNTQGGFDIVSENGFTKIECKFYQDEFKLSDLKKFINKFLDSNDIAKTKTFILCTSCDIARPESLDYVINKNEEHARNKIPLKIKIWDRNKLSQIVHEHKLYSLIIRYFSESEFIDVFSKTIFQRFYGPKSEFKHIKHELKSKLNVPFLLDISENIIRDKKLYINQEKLDNINSILSEHRLCLITAAEGRGKTVISRLVSYHKYYEKNYEVYFCDLRSIGNITDIEYQLYECSLNRQSYLFTFENAHGISELDEFLNIIHKYIKSCDNIFFLINSRHLELDDIPNLSPEIIYNLSPDIQDVKNIIQIYENQTKRIAILQKDTEFFLTKIIAQESQYPVNLRLLNIYLNTWKNQTEKFLHQIEEVDILKEFSTVYKLRSKDEDTLDTLQYFCAIYQLDVPFYVNRKTEKLQFDILNKLVYDGLASKSGNFFLFLHSIDAKYLFNAICQRRNENSVIKSTLIIRRYVEKLIKFSSNLSIRVIQPLYSAILKKDNIYKALLDELVDVEKDTFVTEIILKLDPGFLIYVLTRFSINNKTSLALKYYTQNIETFKSDIANSHSLSVIRIDHILSKYYNYREFTADLFQDTSVLQEWIDRLKAKGGSVNQTLSRIRTISTNHSRIVDQYKSKRTIIQINRAYGIFSASTTRSICIDSKFINSLLKGKTILRTSSKVKFSLIESNDFHLNNISWERFSKFLYIVHLFTLNTNKEFTPVTKFLKIGLMNLETIQYVPTNILSLLLENIKKIDLTFYAKYKSDSNIIKYLEKTIENLIFQDSEFYLLAHFSTGENKSISDRIDRRLKNANVTEKNSIIEFVESYHQRCNEDFKSYFDFLL